LKSISSRHISIAMMLGRRISPAAFSIAADVSSGGDHLPSRVGAALDRRLTSFGSMAPGTSEGTVCISGTGGLA
ncbi:MAG: hypothetical protein ACFNLS_02955, partial [Lancefieldella sp.]